MYLPILKIRAQSGQNSESGDHGTAITFHKREGSAEISQHRKPDRQSDLKTSTYLKQSAKVQPISRTKKNGPSKETKKFSKERPEKNSHFFFKIASTSIQLSAMPPLDLLH
jgi:hypothetical protein